MGLLILGGGTAVYEMTRGLRNNNPGNIVYNPANDWQGQTGRDGAFAVFSDPVYGLRAMGKVLLNYAKQGYTTVDSIIRRWSATDQDAYVANVSAALGVDPFAYIDVASNLPGFFAAITHQENGLNPYSDATLEQAAQLALNG